jgi:hypothetical protein
MVLQALGQLFRTGRHMNHVVLGKHVGRTVVDHVGGLDLFGHAIGGTRTGPARHTDPTPAPFPPDGPAPCLVGRNAGPADDGAVPDIAGSLES